MIIFLRVWAKLCRNVSLFRYMFVWWSSNPHMFEWRSRRCVEGIKGPEFGAVFRPGNMWPARALPLSVGPLWSIRCGFILWTPFWGALVVKNTTFWGACVRAPARNIVASLSNGNERRARPLLQLCGALFRCFGSMRAGGFRHMLE